MEKLQTGFKVCSWNINGIRTMDMKEVLEKLNAQIVAIQETKITRCSLEEGQAFIPNFSSFFAFSRNRSGYSGVATYCAKKFTPVKAEEGLNGMLQSEKEVPDLVLDSHDLLEEEKGLARYADFDGRCMITQHLVQTPDGEEKPLTVFNVYCPRLRDDPSDPVNNRELKMAFHTILERRARQLSSSSFILIVGDLNISHKPIDKSDAVDTPDFNDNAFRQHLDQLLSQEDPTSGFRDTFRLLHPGEEKAFSCWCTRTNARQNNYGTRIDYIIASADLVPYLEKAEIHTDIMGSDHCPISATFHSLKAITNGKHASLSTKFYPEFSGKQLTLKEMMALAKTENGYAPLSNEKIAESIQNVQSRKRPSTTPKGKQTSLTSFFIKKPKIDVQETSMYFQKSENPNSSLEGNSNSSEAEPEENILKRSNGEAKNAWKNLMKTPEVPLCSGHSEPCLLRTVKKKGTNQGRQFWACSKGVGSSTDPNANCNHFQWVINTKTNKLFPSKEVNGGASSAK